MLEPHQSLREKCPEPHRQNLHLRSDCFDGSPVVILVRIVVRDQSNIEDRVQLIRLIRFIDSRRTQEEHSLLSRRRRAAVLDEKVSLLQRTSRIQKRNVATIILPQQDKVTATNRPVGRRDGVSENLQLAFGRGQIRPIDFGPLRAERGMRAIRSRTQKGDIANAKRGHCTLTVLRALLS